ncbi:UDP-glycosyltransferase UGT5-like [Diabrotica virgifera virgifera]|uniref:UDP-glucuronosyltransferase n=1 Tax=Diabrotica virgifera virgifera TaxID=50390 RepID=A0ABM5IJQ2_DIAVI|nr:UDP-glycosyltransferase UGT5-like [Diabrotica virgifera virgifera]
MSPIMAKILFSFVLIANVKSYKILMVFNGVAPSHFFLGNSLGRALAKNGHEVTMVSPFEDKDKPTGYKEVVLTDFLAGSEEIAELADIFKFESMNLFSQVLFFNKFLTECTKATLNHPNFQKLLESNESFDVVIIEQFKQEGLHVLQCHYKAPLILVNTLGSSVWINPYVGNPAPPSYVPYFFTHFSEKMDFWERGFNSMLVLFEQVLLHFSIHPNQHAIAISKFPHCANEKFSNNISLLFLNAHESITQPVPLVPNMINIGGYHIDALKELPKDLKDLLDGAEEGVIYFNLGSNVKSSLIKPDIKEAIVNCLGKLPYKILWKYEDESFEPPKNVEIRKWFPQQDILAHPNVKLFITHGGLLSLTESIHYGVPVLVLPVFGDQKMNAARVENEGYGIKIPFSQINEERFTNALNKLLNDNKYLETARKISDLFHDRPIKPMDLAIYWTEYIAKHKRAPHLRVAGLDLSWYQYFLLDVIAFIVIVVVIVFTTIYVLCRKFGFWKKIKKTKND